MDKKRQETLQALFASDEPLRPVMTSLNGDNSWLISFPRPSTERVALGKTYYHLVFEPWLAGPTSQISSWFIHISLSTPAAVPDAEAVEAVVDEIETAAAERFADVKVARSRQPLDSSQEEYNGGVDAIFLGFHIVDHLHEPTLRLFNPQIPVIASADVASMLKPWGHFKDIKTMRDLDGPIDTWRSIYIHPGDPIPSWLTAFRMPGHAFLNFCAAIIWTHTTEDGSEVHEVILESPHGTRLDEGPLQAFLDAEPPTQKLAMLHGLKESHTAGFKTTFGVKGGLALYRRVGGFKYWLLSHSSDLSYAGIFMRLLRTIDTQRTVSWGLEDERKGQEVDGEELETPQVVQVSNGDSFVLG
ncbi:hypothetical protein FZEAL_3929 [Fusarium zealandicum]|uniref:Uncharacterized protein n=1 Tax=Fusarium zealandicum TaxID=1053134 RepID=A0A8H4UN92_9HYPO|nr:hypothetical protein FZEAL_3929 [Fusarium zealandicum]